MKAFFVIFLLIIGLCILAGANLSHTPEKCFSKLWGKDGKDWNSNGILQDFSIAGYYRSNVSIPHWQKIVNVADFGANGQDSLDDTQAVRQAVRACPSEGVVYIPDGCYILTDTILIKKSNLVIRGAGRGKTKFYFPDGLNEIHPRFIKVSNPKSRIAIQKLNKLSANFLAFKTLTQDAYTTTWSWSGGFIWFQNCSNVGIEGLTFSFRNRKYLGHFKETGSNGINFKLVTNGWAKNIGFYNCDGGIFADSCRYLTFQDFTFNQYAERGKIGGHHGVDFSKSSYCLMKGAVFSNRMIHELGVEHRSHHNVYASCKGVDLHLDHHQIDVHDNLWTDIDLGEGTVVWQTNAKTIQRTKSGSTRNEVYWNIIAKRPIHLPDPQLNNIVVGMTAELNQYHGNYTSWYEIACSSRVSPINIYEAQLKFRKKMKE